VEVYDKFYTDMDGIFRANPRYFSEARNINADKISINRDGFRGNPFERTGAPGVKILLIGDSFTWGAAANPITNSFANLLQQAGYYIYNAGIPGTDPQQYALVAEKYTPLLKPDIVAVCVYMGNDVSALPLLVQPGKNLHYVTSVGFLLGYDDNGRFFKDGREAIEYIKKRKFGCGGGLWDNFLLKTVIGRGIYSILNKKQLPPFAGTKQWIKNSLQRIQDACRKNGSELMVFLIPFVNQDTRENKSIRKNLHLFKGFPCYYPENFTKIDYSKPPDKHFNNQGHRKYADFIIGVLKEKGYDKEVKR
jgi:hypothetical protein